MSVWFRVDADYGAGWVLVGEANDRTGYLALGDRAYAGGAKKVRVYRCESVGGEEPDEPPGKPLFDIL